MSQSGDLTDNNTVFHSIVSIRTLVQSSLTRLPFSVLACSRIFCDARFIALLEAASNSFLVAFEPCPVNQADFSNPAILRIEQGSQAVELLVELSCFPSLERVCALQAEIGDPEYHIKQLVSEIYFERIVEVCAKFGLTKVRVSARRCDVLPDTLARLSMRVVSRGIAIPIGVCRFDELDITYMPYRTSSSTFAFEALLAVRAPAYVRIGEAQLSVSGLTSLSVGDVFFGAVPSDLAHAILTQSDARVSIHWGQADSRHLVGTAMLCGHALTIEKMRMSSQDQETNFGDDSSFAAWRHDEKDDVQESEDSLLDLAELELPVKMEVATVPISLEQFRTIRPGFVIALANSVERAKIRLTVGGQTIGQGELVAVGEHLGVRITQLVQHYDSLA
ncbi:MULTISPECIES: type III secretion system cytoplasmic ring protein SctQ [unclassified Caballeronia]|uniref:type III secretion system cytoplasmic ring protein SctQ n=1 Tax=unclassified Caballeronia TaxID=2646786 RepID=UPI002028B580